MNIACQINSGDLIPPDHINKNFKVTAGPGAGKTYWLIRHVKNVLENTERLDPPQKIACISYTNVAVEEMREDLYQLGIRENYVELSTIHSFLYRNVVRPYLWLLNQQFNNVSIAHNQVDNHFEHNSRTDRIYQWLSDIQESWRGFAAEEGKFEDLGVEFLEKSTWKLEESDWHLVPPKPKGMGGKFTPIRSTYPVSEQKARQYKSQFWEKGIIHHEDVLYFAQLIFESKPELFDSLSARFPYLFIDEFQDTQPAQAKLVKELSEHGTTVGVIGDSEQAIYGFRGATDEVLEEFSSHPNYGVDHHNTYSINGNRRSSETIVDFLNYIRSDGLIQETEVPPDIDEAVRCFFCNEEKIFQEVREFLNQKPDVHESFEQAILAWKNDHVSKFRALDSDIDTTINNLWQKFRDVDGSSYRPRLIRQALRAVRMMEVNDHNFTQKSGVAIREMKKAIKIRNGSLVKPFNCGNVSPLDRRALAMETVRHFLKAIKTDPDQSLYEAYSQLEDKLSTVLDSLGLRGYGGGRTKEFAEQVTLQQLLDSVYTSQPDEKKIRTIHKAKGTEFDNVLVWFPNTEILKEVIDGDSNVASKVYYVAMSRAKKRLFLGVNEEGIDSELESKLSELNVETESIED